MYFLSCRAQSALQNPRKAYSAYLQRLRSYRWISEIFASWNFFERSCCNFFVNMVKQVSTHFFLFKTPKIIGQIHECVASMPKHPSETLPCNRLQYCLNHLNHGSISTSNLLNFWMTRYFFRWDTWKPTVLYQRVPTPNARKLCEWILIC